MDEKENLILKFMSREEYVPMKAKEIAGIFMVPKNKYNNFKSILDKLEKEYKIQKNRKNKYSIIDKDKYIKGTYRGNEKGYGFVIPENEEMEDIFIPRGNNNNALNDDIVVAEIVKESGDGKRKEGKIVSIVKHEKDKVVGLFIKSKNFGFVIPDDKKFGGDIFISKSNFAKAKNNQKVVVKLTKYPEKNKKAEGKIIEIIGGIDEAGVDMLSLVKEYDLPYEFPQGVIEEAKSKGNKVDKKDIPNRVDLRDKTIFTIDGEDAKDLDDAVRVYKNDDGNYMLDVHIADVSYYVTENSLLDKEAIIRGTSIYMLDRVIPMLPKELSNGICSLNAGEDRFTLSCTMEIDKEGNIISSDVYKAVIKVTERMNYKDVQKIIDGSDEKVLEKYKNYIQDFKLMKELAKILKNKRLERGYLNLDLPESKVVLDNNGHAVDIKKYELYFSNEIIEQFMLSANETIAERFYWLEAPFIYRVHEEPDIDKVKELNKFLYNFGYKINKSGDKVYPKEFAKVLDSVKGKTEERVVSNLVLRTLKVARYESENDGHFGIASKYYCHFTSPIRRYPDLFIHRIISKYLENNYELSEKQKEKYEKQAEQYAKTSSDREKIATKVERDSIDIKMAEYMQDRIGEEYEGMVSSVTSFGIFVELDNTVEGLIRFENLGDEYFEYDEEHKQLIGEKTGITYKIGDRVKIKVINANKETRQIDFEKI